MSELKTAVICDREHFFCSCKRVNTVWREVRNIITNCLASGLSAISDLDLITLNFPKDEADMFSVWLLSHYLDLTWKTVYVLDTNLDKEKVFGYLKFKYKSDQLGSRRCMPAIQPLSL